MIIKYKRLKLSVYNKILHTICIKMENITFEQENDRNHISIGNSQKTSFKKFLRDEWNQKKKKLNFVNLKKKIIRNKIENFSFK